ncbi:MAG: DeoR/GlpR transcriptional regulator [Solobacterium sp.]|nr:DeoR/GlpR transcriptional regulator [Solobacterium sp.]
MKNRYKKIMELCSEKMTTVEELVNYFHVSPSTIRRDLADLEDKGMITRVYGGAVIDPDQMIEESNEYKELSMVREKELIARYAASLVQDGDIVYIDPGTTTPRIVKYIGKKNVIIVTQSVDCLNEAKEKNFQVFAAGGYLKRRTNMLIGSETIESLSKMHFNIAFLGANGVHPLRGFTCSEEMESALKACAINRSIKAYICIDSSKFNKLTSGKFLDIEEANVITDRAPENFDCSRFKEVVFAEEVYRNMHRRTKG